MPKVHQLMERGAAQRMTGSTRMNENSSRSHAVFTIIVEKSALADDAEVEQFIGLQTGNPPPTSLSDRLGKDAPGHGITLGPRRAEVLLLCVWQRVDD